MAGRSKPEIKITMYDDLFKTEEQRQDDAAEKVQNIPLAEIDDFPDHPFHIAEGEEMENMVNSIKEYGVLTPAIARKKEDGRYELVSGHRRKRASELAGLETLPVIVKEMSRDEAVIFMVDANLQREHILPSEKAFAYKMKMEAMRHQGKTTSSQLGTKLRTDETIGETAGDSRNQVQRYIRLTELIPELLQMVDEKKIAFNPAVELSYLPKEEQRLLYEAMLQEERTPSLSQAQRMKRLSQERGLDERTMERILAEDKPNQREQIRLPANRIDRFFPKGYTPKQKEDTIIKLLADWQRRRERYKAEQERER